MCIYCGWFLFNFLEYFYWIQKGNVAVRCINVVRTMPNADKRLILAVFKYNELYNSTHYSNTNRRKPPFFFINPIWSTGFASRPAPQVHYTVLPDCALQRHFWSGLYHRSRVGVALPFQSRRSLPSRERGWGVLGSYIWLNWSTQPGECILMGVFLTTHFPDCTYNQLDDFMYVIQVKKKENKMPRNL